LSHIEGIERDSLQPLLLKGRRNTTEQNQTANLASPAAAASEVIRQIA
jgi:hypothetical protein